MNMALSCQQVIDFLDDYLDGSLEPQVRADFEKHLGHCPPCKGYLATYRDTIKLTRRCGCHAPEQGDSHACSEKLVQAILAALKQNKPG